MNKVLKDWIDAGTLEARDEHEAQKLLGQIVVASRGGFSWTGTLVWAADAGVRVDEEDGTRIYLGWRNGDDRLVIRPVDGLDPERFADLEDRLGWWLFPNRPEIVR